MVTPCRGLGSKHTEIHAGIWHHDFVVVPDQGLLLLDATAAYHNPESEDRGDTGEEEAHYGSWKAMVGCGMLDVLKQ